MDNELAHNNSCLLLILLWLIARTGNRLVSYIGEDETDSEDDVLSEQLSNAGTPVKIFGESVEKVGVNCLLCAACCWMFFSGIWNILVFSVFIIEL
jgi:hypothetical protein